MMTLAPGARLGQYEILSPLGAGGMGQVYRARDLRLGREVAIKVLPPETMNDPAARERFEREARAVAALSHPNILAIYQFDTHEGLGYAVTELLEGDTLREALARARMPWTRAISIAGAICDGLAAAHQKGIIHRDLKPANTFLTHDGQVKILDFGLARTRPAFGGGDEASTELQTAPGTVMGTLGYMSPEQLRGDVVDVATDIFAVGCMLYEMVAGTGPFARTSAVDTAAAVLHADPPDVPTADAPPALLRIIRRCLNKSPTERYQSARDLAFDLRALVTNPQGPEPAAWRVRSRRNIALVTVAGILLFIAVAMWGPWRKDGAQTAIRSVIVVPFENGTSAQEMEYLSDGIPEGLTNALARVPNLRVVARTTAFRYKGKPLDLAQMRRELNVDAVLSGRVSGVGSDLVVQTDLMDTVSGAQLWGERFREKNTGLVHMEQEIVRRISEALQMKLSTAQQAGLSRPSTQNSDAYKLYLQGRFFWNKRNPDAIGKAKNLFEQAIRIDPGFALAYSGLADAYTMLGGTYRVMPPLEARERGSQAVRTALRLDPDLAEAHASLGLIELSRFHWEGASRELKRAMEINPSYAPAFHWYSALLLAQGQVDASLATIRKAEQIDPLSAVIATNVALRLAVRGDYAAAVAQAHKAQELDPGFVWAYLFGGLAYEELGQSAEAAAAFRKGGDVEGPAGVREALRLLAEASLGNKAEATRLARLLEDLAERGEISLAWAGWGYAAAGNRDKAFVWLNRALEERETDLRELVRTPIARPLRDDPRYAELLRRLARGFDD